MRIVLVSLWVSLLCGCSLWSPNEELEAQQSMAPEDEVQGTGQVKAFELHARLALRQGLYRDTMVLDWHHTRESDLLKFSTPIGTEIGEVDADNSGAVLHWVNQAPQKAASAETLLKDVMGVGVPLRDLADWVQGRLPSGSVLSFEGEGPSQSARFRVLGWEGRLDRWRPVGGALYPGLVTLQQDNAELKMVIDRWGLVRDD